MTTTDSTVDVKQSSKQPTKPKKVKISDEASCVITITERGRYKCRGYDETKTKAERKAQRREDAEKMSRSWFINKTKLGTMVSKDGVNWRHLNKGEKVYHYDSKVPFIAGSYHDCYSQIRLDSNWVKANKSLENRPAKMSEQEWKSKGDYGRLLYHASLIAEGKPFTMEILN